MKILLVVVATVFLGGCSVAKEYVIADKATLDVIAPEYVEYVNADARLDAEAKARRVRLIESWKLRVEKNR